MTLFLLKMPLKHPNHILASGVAAGLNILEAIIFVNKTPYHNLAKVKDGTFGVLLENNWPI